MTRVASDRLFQALRQRYPDAKCTLNWSTPLELLVATILSAQCTDARVNQVTKSLFARYKTIDDYALAPRLQLERDIHSCGTFRMKAKAIQETARTLLRDFGGNVPRTMEEMLTLRGVGRKTAAVVLGDAYGVHEGIAVDTHVMRVSRRLGLTKARTQTGIETELMKQFPRAQWSAISHLLIAHGRAVCTARGHECHCREDFLRS